MSLSPAPYGKTEATLAERLKRLKLENLSDIEKEYVALWMLSNEVVMGSFEKYVSQSPHNMAPTALKALEDLGCTRVLKIVRDGMSTIDSVEASRQLGNIDPYERDGADGYLRLATERLRKFYENTPQIADRMQQFSRRVEIASTSPGLSNVNKIRALKRSSDEVLAMRATIDTPEGTEKNEKLLIHLLLLSTELLKKLSAAEQAALISKNEHHDVLDPECEAWVWGLRMMLTLCLAWIAPILHTLSMTKTGGRLRNGLRG